MQPGYKLRVAGCAQFRPCSILWTGFYSKTQPATYIGLCFFILYIYIYLYMYICIYVYMYICIYVYILYNIIKNKKKEPTHRVAPKLKHN